MDVEGIPYGVNFKANIEETLGQCEVLLVVIGDQWLSASYHDGPKKGLRRLNDPEDYVRLEIELALAHNITVIPVLVENAKMPGQNDLPEELANLALLNAAEVRSGTTFRDQVDRLIEEIVKHSSVLGAPPPSGKAFHNVWYRAEPVTRSKLLRLSSAPEDTGALVIRVNEVDFMGSKLRVIIRDITGLSFGRFGADYINQWVKVEYIETKEKKVALFKDGGLFGWQGILGGTKEIFNAINAIMPKPPNNSFNRTRN
jgi:hypothetical protein